MTEFSGLWTTSGTPSGDQQTSYTQAQLSVAFSLLSANSKFEGVSPNYLNELEPTDGGSETVNINTGGAIVDGKYYNNSASVPVNIPAAVGGGNTRIDRIVLRADWSAFTVRIFRVAGTDAASPTVPTITQTPGSTYDIYLAQVLVDTGGSVVVTDEREIASVGPVFRQGGSGTEWVDPGTTTYDTDGMMTQIGVINWTGSSANNGVKSVTFPRAFSGEPIVFATAYFSPSGGYVYCQMESVFTTGCDIEWKGTISATVVTLMWIAIGPK